jgi:hypothetical protein
MMKVLIDFRIFGLCQPKLLLGHKKRAHTNRALYSQFQYFSRLIDCKGAIKVGNFQMSLHLLTWWELSGI